MTLIEVIVQNAYREFTKFKASKNYECRQTAEADGYFNINDFYFGLCGNIDFKRQVANALKSRDIHTSRLWNIWRGGWNCNPKFIEVHHSHADSIKDKNCRASFNVSKHSMTC